jgi:hypothetical protein
LGGSVVARTQQIPDVGQRIVSSEVYQVALDEDLTSG